MPRSRAAKIIAMAVAAALVAALVAGILISRGRGSAQPVAASAPGGRIKAGPRAPALAGKDVLSGKRVSLADYAGKPVVINIWASWCPGCNQEAPHLARFAREHPEAGVLGIDIEDTAKDAKAYYRRYDLTFPSISDPQANLARKLRFLGLPTTIFLNREHREVSRIVGAGDLRGFEKGLEQAKHAT